MLSHKFLSPYGYVGSSCFPWAELVAASDGNLRMTHHGSNQKTPFHILADQISETICQLAKLHEQELEEARHANARLQCHDIGNAVDEKVVRVEEVEPFVFYSSDEPELSWPGKDSVNGPVLTEKAPRAAPRLNVDLLKVFRDVDSQSTDKQVGAKTARLHAAAEHAAKTIGHGLQAAAEHAADFSIAKTIGHGLHAAAEHADEDVSASTPHSDQEAHKATGDPRKAADTDQHITADNVNYGEEGDSQISGQLRTQGSTPSFAPQIVHTQSRSWNNAPSHKFRQFHIRQAWFDSDEFRGVMLSETMDGDFAARDSASRAKERRHSPAIFQGIDEHRWYILNPESKVRTFWVLLYVYFLSSDLFFVPFDICFEPQETRFHSVMQLVSTIFWTADIPLTFITGVPTLNGLQTLDAR